MKRLFLLLILLFGCSSAMTLLVQKDPYFFIVPQTGDGRSRETGYRPKYFHIFDSRISRISSMNIGLDSLFLVRVVMEETLRDSIAALSDVNAFPKNINNTLTTGAVTTIKNKLEAKKIPAGWINTSTTYKEVIKFVALIAQLHQRFDGLFGDKLLPAGVTLNTTFSQLPQAGKNKLNALADSFGFSKGSITGSSTLRFIFKELVKQWNSKLKIGSVDLNN